MVLMHPFLLLVLAGFGAFMSVLLFVSLRLAATPPAKPGAATSSSAE